jgi:hypothetical protein
MNVYKSTWIFWREGKFFEEKLESHILVWSTRIWGESETRRPVYEMKLLKVSDSKGQVSIRSLWDFTIKLRVRRENFHGRICCHEINGKSMGKNGWAWEEFVNDESKWQTCSMGSFEGKHSFCKWHNISKK